MIIDRKQYEQIMSVENLNNTDMSNEEIDRYIALETYRKIREVSTFIEIYIGIIFVIMFLFVANFFMTR